jgi:hypothetical protein
VEIRTHSRGETTMRFLCIYKPGKPETDRFTPPSQEEMAAMGKLIGEMQEAGVFISAEGCLPTSMGARVRNDGGNFIVTDGPFAETKELISGMCMIHVSSKEEAIAWAKRFLAVVGGGTSEILQLHETPACG